MTCYSVMSSDRLASWSVEWVGALVSVTVSAQPEHTLLLQLYVCKHTYSAVPKLGGVGTVWVLATTRSSWRHTKVIA